MKDMIDDVPLMRSDAEERAHQRSMPDLNNRAFDTVLFSRGGYLVGRVRGFEFWTDEKRWALRFRGVDAAMLLARTISAATVPMNYFDDAVDPAILRGM